MSPAPSDSDGPIVFSAHLSDLLQREYDRMATLTSRGEVIGKTVLTVATVVLALATLALSPSIALRPHATTWWMAGAAGIAGLVSLAAASLAQSAPTSVEATDSRTMQLMLGSKWDDPADDPRRIVANRTLQGIESLRAGNKIRAAQAQFALWSQFAFFSLIVLTIGAELVVVNLMAK